MRAVDTQALEEEPLDWDDLPFQSVYDYAVGYAQSIPRCSFRRALANPVFYALGMADTPSPKPVALTESQYRRSLAALHLLSNTPEAWARVEGDPPKAPEKPERKDERPPHRRGGGPPRRETRDVPEQDVEERGGGGSNGSQ